MSGATGAAKQTPSAGYSSTDASSESSSSSYESSEDGDPIKIVTARTHLPVGDAPVPSQSPRINAKAAGPPAVPRLQLGKGPAASAEGGVTKSSSFKVPPLNLGEDRRAPAAAAAAPAVSVPRIDLLSPAIQAAEDEASSATAQQLMLEVRRRCQQAFGVVASALRFYSIAPLDGQTVPDGCVHLGVTIDGSRFSLSELESLANVRAREGGAAASKGEGPQGSAGGEGDVRERCEALERENAELKKRLEAKEKLRRQSVERLEELRGQFDSLTQRIRATPATPRSGPRATGASPAAGTPVTPPNARPPSALVALHRILGDPAYCKAAEEMPSEEMTAAIKTALEGWMTNRTVRGAGA
ncbi:unnamed protein product [Pedinophyceae sp. YPF-701]|nr:unnamed protein product [Pedinophyceae sp. YPF-701]